MSQLYNTTPLHVTLDTNIVRDFLEKRCDLKTFERAINSARNGKIKLHATGRMYADSTSKTKDDDSYARFLENCTFLDTTIPSPFRTDSSRTDFDVCDAGGYYQKMHNEIYKIVFSTSPKRQDKIRTISDLDHFIAHIRHKNHIFVTNDKPFAESGVRKKLTELYKTVIMNLDEFDDAILKKSQ